MPESLEVTYSFLNQIQTHSARGILLQMFINCSAAVPRNFSQGPSFIHTSLEDSTCPRDLHFISKANEYNYSDALSNNFKK